MRVLFLESHAMWVHGLPNGFRDLHHEVRVAKPLTKAYTERLIATFEPDLIISMSWTTDNAPQKRQWLRRYIASSGAPFVYWATEDPTHAQTYSIPLVKQLKPDFVFTICSAQVERYHAMGIPAAHMDFGHHHSVHYPAEKVSHYAGKIALVANGYPRILSQYENHFRHQSLKTLVKPLLVNRIRTEIWGKNWGHMKPHLGVAVPHDWMRGYLSYPEAFRVYAAADIILGPQNHLTQLTQRTYETMASGGVLLTSDTPEIRRLFRPGRDLFVSSSPTETLEIIQFLIANPGFREKMRGQAMQAVAPHSYRHRAKYMIATLRERGIIDRRLDKGLFKGTGRIRYTVRQGDTLERISRAHGVSIAAVKAWNGLYSGQISVGQSLLIYR